MRRAQPEQVRREVGVEVAHRLEGGLVALEVDGPREARHACDRRRTFV